MKSYDLINANNPKLNAFDLSHNHIMTLDFGKIYPVSWYECVPGDVYDLDFQALIRVQPMLAPIMNNITCELDAYFVPTRLLYKDWVKFITTVDDDNIPPETFEGSPPVWAQSDNDQSIADIDTSSMSLWDCFGLSRKFSPTAPAEARPVDFLRRAYYFIYNEWYRDENLQQPVDFFNDKTQELKYRSWKKDYFTSAFYDRQKGVSPSIPISGTGSVNFNLPYNTPRDDIFHSTAFSTGKDQYSTGASLQWNVQPIGTQTGFISIGPNASKLGDLIFPVGDPNNPFGILSYGTDNILPLLSEKNNASATMRNFQNWLNDNNSFDLNNVGTFNVSDMRDMFAIQRFLEGLMRGGSRYIEFLQFQFGVSPSDARLQIPERIGGSSFNVQISEVLQTGETTATSPQGNMSGHGLSVTQNSLGNYKCEEFGYIIVVATIMPPAIYKDRVPRELYRKTLLEQFSPYFVNLSYQAIYERELYALGNVDNVNGDNKIFGYQGRYDEMREKLSYLSGDFYDKLSYYLNARSFANAPALNDDFLKCRPNQDIFAVTDEPPFLCNFYWNTKALRPMPIISEPGLIDHVYGGI